MSRKLITIIGAVVIIGLLVLIVVMSSVSAYNKMVKYDEGINEAWSQVENVYQRRADLIPNLVNTVKGYAEYEQETLTQVIEARSKATSVNVSAENLNEETLAKFQEAQQGLSSALSRLLVVVEKYPDLKANQGFLDLQAQLEGTENRIATERRRFNEVTREFNTYIRKFPNNIFAGWYNFDQRPYFKADEGADKAPEVKF
jgi:LemA protein